MDPNETLVTVRLLAALEQLPERHYVRLGIETSEEGEPFLSACIMEEPPEGGWETRGAYFDHTPNYADYNDPADPFLFDDGVRTGVSTAVGDSRFWGLLLNAILDYTAKRSERDRQRHGARC